MQGDPHFEFRARLGSTLFALKELAREAGLPEDRQALVANLVAGLREPFLFIVSGEVNAGKSSFLNALFGAEFCGTGVVPTTGQIHWFKHDRTDRDESLSREFATHFRTHAFLRDFQVIDTPGVNSIAPEHEAIAQRILPRADMVIFVFNVTNPWSEAAWKFLERVRDSWLKRVIFVLQQCDLREPDEVVAVVDYLRQTIATRLGRSLPIFPVSARRAYVAKTSPHPDGELLAASGFPALEAALMSAVAGTPARNDRLLAAVHAGRSILREIVAAIDGAASTLERDGQCLDVLKGEAGAASERTAGWRRAAKENFARAYDRAAAACRAAMDERALRDELSRQIDPFVASSAPLLATDLTELDRRINAGLPAVASAEANAAIPPIDRASLGESFRTVADEAVDGSGVGDLIAKSFTRRKRHRWAAAILGGAGVAVAALGHPALDLAVPASVGLGAAVALVGAGLLWQSARQYRGEGARVEAALDEGKTYFVDGCARALDSAAQEAFEAYGQRFAPMIAAIQRRQDGYDSILLRVRDCGTEFDRFESVLAPPS